MTKERKLAVLSKDKVYRYRLDRIFRQRDGPLIGFFGINPSTADAAKDDATVRKWRGFANKLGARGFVVGNVFAYRATDVKALLIDTGDPEGPCNKHYIDQIIDDCDILIPCWGNKSKVPSTLTQYIDTLERVIRTAGKPAYCFGKTKSGDPKHPLMLGYDTPLEDF